MAVAKLYNLARMNTATTGTGTITLSTAVSGFLSFAASGIADGDTVTIAKDLKVKGAANSIKVGTKVRNIRLVNGGDGHDIEAKVDGFGQMMLKSSVVKKVL